MRSRAPQIACQPLWKFGHKVVPSQVKDQNKRVALRESRYRHEQTWRRCCVAKDGQAHGVLITPTTDIGRYTLYLAAILGQVLIRLTGR
jgi:hypothetical protein